jgi:hypothetical protein
MCSHSGRIVGYSEITARKAAEGNFLIRPA